MPSGREDMSDVGSRPRALTLGAIRKKGSGSPNRAILYGVEGGGKTSFGASAPRPVFLMTRGETGLQTPIDAGRVPDTPHFPELMSWPEVLAAIDALQNEDHDYRTLVIDTLNGCERLCHEYVCQRDFN